MRSLIKTYEKNDAIKQLKLRFLEIRAFVSYKKKVYKQAKKKRKRKRMYVDKNNIHLRI